MNEYHAIARKYFQYVEGWHLYRSKGDRLLWLWLGVSTAWITLFVPLARSIFDWRAFGAWLGVVLLLEIVVLLVGGRISDRKRAALVAEVNREFSVALADEEECRVFLLSKLLERPADKFFPAVKEISELGKLRQEFRGSNETELGYYWRIVYDRDSKPRLVAVTLGALTVCTALTIRGLPDAPLLFDLISDSVRLTAVRNLVVLSALLFVVLVGARAIFRTAWHVVTIWAAKSLPSNESPTVLRYFARDLIRLHKPVAVVVVHVEEDACPERSAVASIAEQRSALLTSSPSAVSRGIRVALVLVAVVARVVSAKRRG